MIDIENAQKFLLQVQWSDVILFLIAIAFLTFLAKIVEYSANLIANQSPKNRMLILGWVPLISFAIYFIGTFLAIDLIINPSKDTLLGFLASGLIAVGFAVKDIAASIIAGVVILIDKPFQVGDRVRFQDVYGDITSIGLSSVRLVNLDDDMVTIPNHLLINNIVESTSAGALGMRTVIDVFFPPEADLEKVRNIMDKIARNSPLTDQNKDFIVIASETLDVNGTITITMKMKCRIKDSRTEMAFQTYFIIETNKEFKKENIPRRSKPALSS